MLFHRTDYTYLRSSVASFVIIVWIVGYRACRCRTHRNKGGWGVSVGLDRGSEPLILIAFHCGAAPWKLRLCAVFG